MDQQKIDLHKSMLHNAAVFSFRDSRLECKRRCLDWRVWWCRRFFFSNFYFGKCSHIATAALSVAQIAMAQVGQRHGAKKKNQFQIGELLGGPPMYERRLGPLHEFFFSCGPFGSLQPTVGIQYVWNRRCRKRRRTVVNWSVRPFGWILLFAGKNCAMLVLCKLDPSCATACMRRLNQKIKCQPYAWFRALASRTFQVKESQWQRDLEEWEGEIGRKTWEIFRCRFWIRNLSWSSRHNVTPNCWSRGAFVTQM